MARRWEAFTPVTLSIYLDLLMNCMDQQDHVVLTMGDEIFLVLKEHFVPASHGHSSLAWA